MVDYPAAYHAAPWGPEVRVDFPDRCTMTFSTTGEPAHHADYYLAPARGPRAVARTPVSNMPMMLIGFPSDDIGADDLSVNTCPAKAPRTTPTHGGPIGYTIEGEAIFNAYEATGEAALADNVSYSFANRGTRETASFIDSCNSHAAGGPGGAQWHHHGVPLCLTNKLDGNGPSHLLGFALDGFPIYGGRDIRGNLVSVSQLDACNGITSPTPEFPGGAYHYVLPIGITSGRSSLNCFSGFPNTGPPGRP